MSEHPAHPDPTLRETDALTLPLRVSDLSARGSLRFRLTPTAEARADLATDLGALKIRKLDFTGQIVAEGRSDWRLEGKLGATVVQECVITAEPVTTRIDEPVTRRFVRDMPVSSEPEVEIPEDDTLEPLGPVIDPGAVMAEALALALPDYPRVPGAELPDSVTELPPEERPNPFAALAKLKKDLGEDGE
ncbi:YceD family protein [Pararhodobacter aggregans]|uniref:YceD family protein n=1 Tax=Pararhodobacter aggregans TaxID=404875 RepID=UPI003A8FD5F7